MRLIPIIMTVLLSLASTAASQNCPTLQTKKESLAAVANRAAMDPTYVGTVDLLVEVSETGRTLSAEVVSSTNRVLEKRAIKEVKAWKFEPAKKDGKPVRVQAAVEVDFHQNDKCELTSSQPFLPFEKSQ